MKTDSKNSSAAEAANEKMIANPIQEKISQNGFCYQNRKEKITPFGIPNFFSHSRCKDINAAQDEQGCANTRIFLKNLHPMGSIFEKADPCTSTPNQCRKHGKKKKNWGGCALVTTVHHPCTNH